MNILGTMTVMLGVNTAGLSRAATNMKRFETQVLASNGKIQASFAAVGSQMALTGAMMTQYFTVPLGILGGVATKAFSDFEFSLAKVTGLVGIAAETTKGWGDQMLRMAGDVGKAPRELGESLYYITTSGVRGAESMEILRHSALAAAAGLGQTRVVADALTSAVNAYGKEVLTTREATDILIAGIREAKTEPEQFASSIGKIFPVAAQLGVSFNDVSAGLASMTRTGTKAAEASTYLRRMFFTLIQEPPKAEKELNRLGLSFEELRNVLRNKGLLDMLLLLKSRVGDNITAFGDIFPNIRALVGVLDILGPNLENNKEIFEALSNTAGTFNNAIGAVEKTVQFRWKKTMADLMASMVELGAVIKEPVMELIQGLANYIKQLIANFTSLDSKTQKNILLWSSLAVVLGPAIIALGAVITAMKTIMGLALGATLSGIIIKLLALGAAAYYTAKNWELLNTVTKKWIAEKEVQALDKKLRRMRESLADASEMWSDFISKMGERPEIARYQELENQITDLQTKMASTPENLHDEREDIYNQIVVRLKEIEGIRKKLLDLGIAEVSVTGRQYNELKKTSEQMFEWQRRLASADVDISLFKQAKDDALTFKDFFSKVFSDIGNDVQAGMKMLKEKIGLDDLFSGVGGGLELGKELGNLRQLDLDLDAKVRAFVDLEMANEQEAVNQLNDNLMQVVHDFYNNSTNALEIPVRSFLNTYDDPLKGLDKNASRFAQSYALKLNEIQDILDATTTDLEINAEAAERLGSIYNKTGTDVDILSASISKLTKPDVLELMTDYQLVQLKELMQEYENLTGKQQKVLNATSELNRVFSTTGTFLRSISRYIGDTNFAHFISGVSEMVQITSQFISVMRAITALLEKLNLIKKASAVLTGKETAAITAETGATIANAAAKKVSAGASQMEAAASAMNSTQKTTEAVTTGVASSMKTAKNPLLGLVLAAAVVAGILAIVASGRSKSKGVAQLADGGIIPPGFPNDTFPAMLSSNEAVIPLTKLQKMIAMDRGEEKPVKVVFVQKGRQLEGVMYAQSKVTQAF